MYDVLEGFDRFSGILVVEVASIAVFDEIQIKETKDFSATYT